MAILSVIEAYRSLAGSTNTRREREYTRHFDVVSDIPNESQALVESAPTLPRLWNPYVTPLGAVDMGSVAESIKVVQDPQDPFLWRVEIRYTNNPGRPDINQQENPLLRPAEVSWSTSKITLPMEKDADGTPIVNTAGERFDPPLEREERFMILNVKLNQANFIAANLLLYEGRTNRLPFMGFPRGMVLLEKVASSKAFENNIFFWPTMYEFWIKMIVHAGMQAVDVWANTVLNRGFFQKVDGKLKIITDALGKPMATPSLLALDGTKLPVGGAPVFLVFYKHMEADFNELALF